MITQSAPDTAIVLLNVGSPDSPTPGAVYRYLRQFLMDERVIDIPFLQRWLLVNLIIAPTRSSGAARRYASVWTPQGSPLVALTRQLAAALSAHTGVPVFVGMAYGQPSIRSAVAAARKHARVVVIPMFPQYASATTGGVLAGVAAELAAGDPTPEVRFRPSFAADPAFLDLLAARVPTDVDHVLCSFHGLPERQLTKLDGACLSPGCCDRPSEQRWSCYRAGCMDTVRGLRERLSVPVSYSFQSRLGREKWLGPETEAALAALVQAGNRRIAVTCPSFVTDCLETLEEIAIEARAAFLKAGGESLVVVPCLNADADWVRWLADWAGVSPR